MVQQEKPSKFEGKGKEKAETSDAEVEPYKIS